MNTHERWCAEERIVETVVSVDANETAGVPEESARPNEWALYENLAREFDITFSDNRGGAQIPYITGEQCASRLNETLGFLNWSFRIIEHGIHAEADECWALAELTVTLDGRTTTRQQFGSQKVKRSRSSGTPLDIGVDLKGAGTDALKKCASLIGVALYLHEKEPPQQQAPRRDDQGGSGLRAMPAPGDAESLFCEDCGEPLTDTTFRNGDVWSAQMLGQSGRRKYGRVLCMKDYRSAKQQAEAPAF